MAVHPAIRSRATPLLDSLRKRLADGEMRSEHWALLRFAAYLAEDHPGEPGPINAPGVARHIGPQTSGSENHGPMGAGAATLGILSRPAGERPGLADQAATAWEAIYAHFLKVGHQGTEFGAPYGTWVCAGFACAAIVGHEIGHDRLRRVGHAYLADDVAAQGAIRTPLGIIIPVGCRMSGVVEHTVPPLSVRAQILNPVPDPVRWLAERVQDGLPRGAKGWGNEGAVGELLLCHAVHSGAVDTAILRHMAATVRPKVVSPVYRWREGRTHRVRLPVTLGLPPVIWQSSWTEGDEWPKIEGAAGEGGQWGKNPHRFADSPPGVPPVLGTERVQTGTGSPPPPPPEEPPEEEPMPEEVPPPRVAQDPDLRKVQQALEEIRDNHPVKAERRWAHRSLRKLNELGAWE